MSTQQTYEQRVRAIATGLAKCKGSNKYRWYGLFDGEVAEAKNKFFIDGDTCFIELEGGEVAQFDTNRFLQFKNHRWCIASKDKTGKGRDGSYP